MTNKTSYRHCIICYKICGELKKKPSTSGRPVPLSVRKRRQSTSNSGNGSEQVLHKFLKWLERYVVNPSDSVDFEISDDNLQGDCDNDDVKLFQKLMSCLEAKSLPFLSSCEDCALQMREFCKTFQEMQRLDLILQWKLWTLKNIMFSAQRVASRVNFFKETWKTINDDVVQASPSLPPPLELDQIFEVKRTLIRKCNRRLSSSFPKVKLKRAKRRKMSNLPEVSTTGHVNGDKTPELNLSESENVTSMDLEEEFMDERSPEGLETEENETEGENPPSPMSEPKSTVSSTASTDIVNPVSSTSTSSLLIKNLLVRKCPQSILSLNSLQGFRQPEARDGSNLDPEGDGESSKDDTNDKNEYFDGDYNSETNDSPADTDSDEKGDNERRDMDLSPEPDPSLDEELPVPPPPSSSSSLLIGKLFVKKCPPSLLSTIHGMRR